jgi:hypothetical protein
MTRDQLLSLADDALLKLCRTDCFRAPGPGGQHRNKVDSAVRLTLKEHPEVCASATESRSQHTNRRQALVRLRREIAHKIRSESAPKWDGQLKFNVDNPEYPTFLGIVIDALTQAGWRVGDAARLLSTSTGKLNKVLFKDQHLWELVNRSRESAGMGRLRPPK